MKKIIFAIISFCVQATISNAQCSKFLTYIYPGLKYYIEANDLIQLKDSSYILTGLYYKYNPFYSVTPFHFINNCGQLTGSKIYGPDGGGVTQLVPFDDTSYVCAGGFVQIPLYGIVYCKINLQGDTFDLHTFPYIDGHSEKLFRTADSGFVMQSPGAGNKELMKLDKNMNEVYSNAFPAGVALAGIQDYDGNLVFCGTNSHGLTPYCVAKYDTTLTNLWYNYYGEYFPWAQSEAVHANSICLMPDSNYLVACDGFDWNLMKIDHNTGDTIWTRVYDTSAANTFRVKSMARTLQDNYIGVCTNIFYPGTQTFHFVLFDTNGDTIWSRPVDDSLLVLGIKQDLDGGYVYWGQSLSLIGNFAFIIGKLDSFGNAVYTNVFEMPIAATELTVFPNPATTQIEIVLPQEMENSNTTITIYDAWGSLKFEVQSLKLGYPRLNIDSFSNGIYFVVANNGKAKYRTSFVKME